MVSRGWCGRPESALSLYVKRGRGAAGGVSDALGVACPRRACGVVKRLITYLPVPAGAVLENKESVVSNFLFGAFLWRLTFFYIMYRTFGVKKKYISSGDPSEKSNFRLLAVQEI